MPSPSCCPRSDLNLHSRSLSHIPGGQLRVATVRVPLGAAVRGDHRARLLQVSSLGDAKSSLGDAKSSLGDAKSSLGDAKSSLGDVYVLLGAESSLSDAESSRWVTLRARWVTLRAR